MSSGFDDDRIISIVNIISPALAFTPVAFALRFASLSAVAVLCGVGAEACGALMLPSIRADAVGMCIVAITLVELNAELNASPIMCVVAVSR